MLNVVLFYFEFKACYLVVLAKTRKPSWRKGNARQQCMYEGPLRTNVKSVKTSILVLKVIQGHCFRCQSKPVYDFVLVINCNLGPISHRFRDMASYWFKIAKFSSPLSFRAIGWGDPYGFFGKALQILKLESLGQPMVKIWWSFSLHRFCLIHPCDRQTDGQNCDG